MTTLTLKLGGALLDDQPTLASLATQLALLQEAGVRPCLVHGGGPQISQALAAAGIPDQRHAGLRITPPEAATIVQQEMDALGKELAAALTRAGLAVFHVAGSQDRLTATPKVAEVDLGRVGTATGFDALGLPGPVGGPIPIVTPVGTDGQGPLNVNADEGAATIAAALGSDHLVLATDVPGVQGPDGTTIHHLGPAQARHLVETGTARGGMIPKLEAGLGALADGVRHVHVTSLDGGTLTALISGRGDQGTHLHATKGVLA